MTDVIRIQMGHYGRTRGGTGSHNKVRDISEAEMNKYLADKIMALWNLGFSIPGCRLEITGPDDKPKHNAKVFVSLHMDGSDDTSVQGGSVGYPKDRKSIALAASLKASMESIDADELMTRPDNNTPGLAKYYGYNAIYSGTAAKTLIEVGFVTNNEQLDWAIVNREQIARAILQGIANYLGRVLARPTITITPPAQKAASSWEDSRPTTRHGRVERQAELAREALASADKAVVNLERLGLSGPDREN